MGFPLATALDMDIRRGEYSPGRRDWTARRCSPVHYRSQCMLSDDEPRWRKVCRSSPFWPSRVLSAILWTLAASLWSSYRRNWRIRYSLSISASQPRRSYFSSQAVRSVALFLTQSCSLPKISSVEQESLPFHQDNLYDFPRRLVQRCRNHTSCLARASRHEFEQGLTKAGLESWGVQGM